MVSPPTVGASRMCRIEPSGGVPRNVTSVCHHDARSSRPSMGRTSEFPSIEGMTGCAGVTSPNCRAKSACCAGSRSWPGKNSTRW